MTQFDHLPEKEKLELIKAWGEAMREGQLSVLQFKMNLRNVGRNAKEIEELEEKFRPK